MVKSFPLSPFQSVAVLDHAPVAELVSSVDDRSLLYANRLAKGQCLCLECTGMNSHVPKPIDADLLQSVLSDMIDHR